MLRKEALDNKYHDFSEEDNASIEALLSCDEYKNATSVFAFVPLPSEVNITTFLEIAVKEKKLALPKCLDEGVMEFCLAERVWHQGLVKSSRNIVEPIRESIIEPDEHSLILVPALAFSKLKQRLGRGLGYYDRFLTRFPSVMTIGICRKYQFFDDIPVEKHDKHVNKVLVNGIFY